jgi:hypothetical protein
MDVFIVILLFIKLGLVFCIVILPALAFCGFGALGFFSRRIRNVRVRAGALGVAAVGMVAMVAWSIGNDAIGVVQWAAAWP